MHASNRAFARVSRHIKSAKYAYNAANRWLSNAASSKILPNNFRIALDWTPNAGHCGIFAAQELGLFQDAGLSVAISSPAFDGYAKSPASRLATGEADLILCPSETVISMDSLTQYDSILAVARIFDRDTSSIAVRADSGITRPKDLEGKKYASYKARFEDHIVAAMVSADGGQGILDCSTPPRLECFESVLTGTHDATWIFDWWEGVIARRRGIELKTFRMEDVGIPYGPSPVLAAAAHSFGGVLDPEPKDPGAKGRGISAFPPGDGSPLVADGEWAMARRMCFSTLMQCISDGYALSAAKPAEAAGAVHAAHQRLARDVQASASPAATGTTDLTPPDLNFFEEAQEEVSAILRLDQSERMKINTPGSTRSPLWGELESAGSEGGDLEQKRLSEHGRAPSIREFSKWMQATPRGTGTQPILSNDDPDQPMHRGYRDSDGENSLRNLSTCFHNPSINFCGQKQDTSSSETGPKYQLEWHPVGATTKATGYTQLQPAGPGDS